MVYGQEWTGFGAVALQTAMRLSNKDFARTLGVETTTVSNWRSRLSGIHLRLNTQQILDTVLRTKASEDDRARFEQIVAAGEQVWCDTYRSGVVTTATSLPAAFTDSDCDTLRAGGLEPLESADTRSYPSASLKGVADDVEDRFWRNRIADQGRVQSAEALLGLADESAAVLAWAESSNVGPLTIKDLRDNLRLVTREYLISPTPPLFRRVIDTRDRAIELLQGRQHPKQSAELYRIAGWAITVLAWITTDLGRADIAERHLRAGWALADNAEDDELRAWIRVAENTAASWRGDYETAAEAAADGLNYGGTGTATLLLASARAIDLAHLGRTRESADALHAALDLAARLADEHPHDEFAGPFSCSFERAGGYWADAALANGQAEDSLAFAASALEQFQQAVPAQRNLGSERMVHCQLIKSHLVLGNLDVAGIELDHIIADTPPDRRVGPLVQRIDEIAQLAQQATAGGRASVRFVDAAREFRDAADLGPLRALAAGPDAG